MFKVVNLTQFGSNNIVQLENKRIEGLQNFLFLNWCLMMRENEKMKEQQEKMKCTRMSV